MTLEELAEWMDEKANTMGGTHEHWHPWVRPMFAAAAACRELIDKRTNDAASDDPNLEAETDRLLKACK